MAPLCQWWSWYLCLWFLTPKLCCFYHATAAKCRNKDGDSLAKFLCFLSIISEHLGTPASHGSIKPREARSAMKRRCHVISGDSLLLQEAKLGSRQQEVRDQAWPVQQVIPTVGEEANREKEKSLLGHWASSTGILWGWQSASEDPPVATDEGAFTPWLVSPVAHWTSSHSLVTQVPSASEKGWGMKIGTPHAVESDPVGNIYGKMDARQYLEPEAAEGYELGYNRCQACLLLGVSAYTSFIKRTHTQSM